MPLSGSYPLGLKIFYRNLFCLQQSPFPIKRPRGVAAKAVAARAIPPCLIKSRLVTILYFLCSDNLRKRLPSLRSNSCFQLFIHCKNRDMPVSLCPFSDPVYYPYGNSILLLSVNLRTSNNFFHKSFHSISTL